MTKITDWNYCGTKGYVKKGILKNDIARGVMFLSEGSYSNYTGATKTSMLFFQEVAKYVDFSTTYRIDFKIGGHHYTVTIFTKEGYTVQFKGLSFGYHGEGSRGSLAILQKCGFNDKQISKMFSANKNLKLYRRIA